MTHILRSRAACPQHSHSLTAPGKSAFSPTSSPTFGPSGLPQTRFIEKRRPREEGMQPAEEEVIESFCHEVCAPPGGTCISSGNLVVTEHRSSNDRISGSVTGGD